MARFTERGVVHMRTPAEAEKLSAAISGRTSLFWVLFESQMEQRCLHTTVGLGIPVLRDVGCKVIKTAYTIRSLPDTKLTPPLLLFVETGTED